MKLWVSILFLTSAISTFGQFTGSPFESKSVVFRRKSNSLILKDISLANPTLNYYLERQSFYQYHSPTAGLQSRFNSSQSLWLGSTSTQYFSNGKMGAVHYYDINGNLRNSRNFVDIRGKGNRRIRLFLSSR